MGVGKFFGGLFGDGDNQIPEDWTLLDSKKQIMAEIGLMDPLSRNTTKRLAEILLAPFAGCDRSTRKWMQSGIPANAEQNIARAFLAEWAATTHGLPRLESESRDELLEEFLMENGDRVCRVASSIAMFELKNKNWKWWRRAALLGLGLLVGGWFG